MLATWTDPPVCGTDTVWPISISEKAKAAQAAVARLPKVVKVCIVSPLVVLITAILAPMPRVLQGACQMHKGSEIRHSCR